jgi:hypothetical protein
LQAQPFLEAAHVLAQGGGGNAHLCGRLGEAFRPRHDCESRQVEGLEADYTILIDVSEGDYGVASKLYNEFEAAGARVVIGPGDQRWSGMAINEREVPKDDRQRSGVAKYELCPCRSLTAWRMLHKR